MPKDNTGFGGLSDLVSDISDEIPRGGRSQDNLQTTPTGVSVVTTNNKMSGTPVGGQSPAISEPGGKTSWVVGTIVAIIALTVYFSGLVCTLAEN